MYPGYQAAQQLSDLEMGELGAPDLGFLEHGPSTSEWMRVPLALVPSVIRAGGSLPRHLPWLCHCLVLGSTSEAIALNLTKLKTEGHGLSPLVQQLVYAHPVTTLVSKFQTLHVDTVLQPRCVC